MFNIGQTYLFLCGDRAIMGRLTHVEDGVFALKDAKNVVTWKSLPALRRFTTDGIVPSEDTTFSNITTGASTEFIFWHAVRHAFLCSEACVRMSSEHNDER